MKIVKFIPAALGGGTGSQKSSSQILASAKKSGVIYLDVPALVASVACPTIMAILEPSGKPEELFEVGATVTGVLSVQISDMSDVVSVAQDGNVSNNPISAVDGIYHWDFMGAAPLQVSTEVVTGSCGTVVQVFEIASDGVVTAV